MKTWPEVTEEIRKLHDLKIHGRCPACDELTIVFYFEWETDTYHFKCDCSFKCEVSTKELIGKVNIIDFRSLEDQLYMEIVRLAKEFKETDDTEKL